MSSKVWLSTRGRALDPDAAAISVFDRGFLYGDSVYESLRTAAGRVVELDAHLDRLRRSAEGIAFTVPFTDREIREALRETLEASGKGLRRVRIIVTRGTGPVGLDLSLADSPVLVIMVEDLVPPSDEVYEAGISAVLVGAREGSLRPGLKTGNYLGNILALRQAHQRGADDAIICNADGAVAEGATSNLFMVVDGSVHTPSLATGLLAGITRGVIIRLLTESLGLAVGERTVLPAELRGADELFLTSSIRGIMPLTRLDGAVVGEGRVGPITRRAIHIYRDYLLAPSDSGI